MDNLPDGVRVPNLTEEVEREVAGNPTGWMDDFMLSQEEIDDMQDAKFIIESGAISSQINIWAAKPGCGKTSILMYESSEMVKGGYQVLYVNMDCGAADLKYWRDVANRGGFNMITPHFKGSEGIEQWIKGLQQMSQMDVDLSRVVIVVDTLKKIVDLMSKAKAKLVMNLLRALTSRQCTVICAAHCNKHRTPDGKLMFEGVGDIESDCDSLIYLEGSERDGFGAKTVTTEPSDKVRGIFHKRSWQILENRTVIALDIAVDVAGQREAETRREKDATTIEVVSQGIAANKHKRHELFEYVHERGISQRNFDSVIKRYCRGQTDAKTAPIWWNEPQAEKNACYYRLIDECGG